ncbi:MAG: EF-P lysine aminoacylase EpmA [Myxococcota bacterium]
MKFLERHLAKQAVRRYFDAEGFIEIDSPILIRSNAVEAFIDPIWVGAQELRTSPELYHKRLLARGYKRIYELGHVFRDEAEGRIHLREFSLLEWYRADAELIDLIEDCQKLFFAVAPNLFNRPFEVQSLQELWLQHAKIDLALALSNDNLVEVVLGAGFVLREQADFADAFHHVMMVAIEPCIGLDAPCVVTRWPKEMAALSRLCEDDNRFAERFEIYFRGVELANAFLELTDSLEQRNRFESEQQTRIQLGKKASELDEDFLKDLDSMPPAAGIAVGFDRLMMFACDASNISQICQF